MKKINILFSALLALALTACDEDNGLGIEQVNPQLPVVSANCMTVTPSEAYNGLINLDANVNKMIDIATSQMSDSVPADSKAVLHLLVANNENLSDAKEFTLEDGKVSANDLEDVMVEFYNVTPEEVHPWMAIAAYLQDGKTLSRVGGMNYYFDKKQVKVLPVDVKYDVAAGYTLVGTANVPFVHGEQHQYIDPNFSVAFDVTAEQAAAGYKWQIAPGNPAATTDEAKCYGPGDGGKLELGKVGVITTPGKYRIAANMLEKTYSLTFAFEILYTPGTGNGWNQEASMKLYTVNYADYFGFTITGADTEAKGEFKLDASTDWSMNWGLNDGVLTPGGANIVTEPAGLWWVKANLNALTCQTIHVETIGIIGLNNDWDNDIALTPSADKMKWTATMTADGDTSFKFRVNKDWAANLGGTPEKLVADGDNIGIGAGTYEVTLDISSVPYTCTWVKK